MSFTRHHLTRAYPSRASQFVTRQWTLGSSTRRPGPLQAGAAEASSDPNVMITSDQGLRPVREHQK